VWLCLCTSVPVALFRSDTRSLHTCRETKQSQYQQ
jgi:hypothetical protein